MARKKRPAPKIKQWGRDWHEERALQSAASATRDLVFTRNCDPQAVYSLSRASKDIAHARTHLVSIGPGNEGARTKKIWRVVSKAQRQVDLAADRVAKCMLKKR